MLYHPFFAFLDDRYSCGVASPDSSVHDSPACRGSPSSASTDRRPVAVGYQRIGQEDVHVPAVRLQHYPAGWAFAALRFRSPEDQKSPVRPVSLRGLAEGDPEPTRQAAAQEEGHRAGRRSERVVKKDRVDPRNFLPTV